MSKTNGRLGGASDVAARGRGPGEAPERLRDGRGASPRAAFLTVVADLPDKPDPQHVLTWRQRKVLQVIRESVQRRGYPPSMREIGEAVGLTSTSSVSYQLSTLQSKGYLRRDAGGPRTVEVRLPGHPAVRPEPDVEDETPMDIAVAGSGLRPAGRPDRGWRPDPRRGSRSRTSSRCPGRSSARATCSC